MTTAIQVKHLHFGYEGVSLLKEISLEVPSGSLTLLLGKNGSGKSTLLKLIGGLLPYNRGNITIMDRELNRLSSLERASLIGYLPQFHNPVFPFTVEEVVLTGRAAYVFSSPGKKDKEKVRQALEAMGLEDFRKRPYTELSGGERQLVMIARVLAQEPKVILLDEPLSHLDLANQVRLLRLTKKLTESGLTILAVFHDPNMAFLSGDHFIFLKNGSILQKEKDQNPWEASFISRVFDTPVTTVPFRDRSLIVLL